MNTSTLLSLHSKFFFTYFSIQPEQAAIRDLIVEEYIGSGEDRIRNRDAFTELLGDFLFTFPALKAANAHRGIIQCEAVEICSVHTFNCCLSQKIMTPLCELPDAGASVYLYEYHHAPKILQKIRPSFVKSDHSDEIFTVMGFCFTTTHVKLNGKNT